MLRHSPDDGRTWSAPLTPHHDGTETEHGFVSIVPWPGSVFGSSFGVVWLDGRDFANHPGGEAGMKAEMALRAIVPSQAVAGSIGGSGKVSPPVSVWMQSPEAVVDSRVCECCPTAAVRTKRGVVVAYRDRSAGEVRDIAVARYENGRWTPKVVHADNWKIPGCPVNGPALAASESRVALAWFAAPENNARVKVTFSRDGGVTFGAPIRVDDGLPLGRVTVTTIDDASVLVGWLEYVKDADGSGGASALPRAPRQCQRPAWRGNHRRASQSRPRERLSAARALRQCRDICLGDGRSGQGRGAGSPIGSCGVTIPALDAR